MPSDLLVLSAKDVESIVSDFNPKDLQLLMARLFSHPSNSESVSDSSSPHRLSLPMLNHTALFMPARISRIRHSHSLPGDTAIKVACVPHDSRSRSSDTGGLGLPATTMVLDEGTGSVKAIVNARKLTPLRNAAGSLLSTSLLATSQPESVVAFGAGQQIEAHLDLHLRHFPSLKHCTIINRSRNGRALSLHSKLRDKFVGRVVLDLLAPPGSEVQSALGRADLVICATSSTAPLFPSSYVREGTHVILIGSYRPDMKEVDGDLIARSLHGTLLVDSKDACLLEAGELIDASVRPEELTEFGQLLPVDVQGDLDEQALDEMLRAHRPRRVERSFGGPISIFKSVGLGIQDVAIAAAVIQKALDSHIGTVIPKFDSDV